MVDVEVLSTLRAIEAGQVSCESVVRVLHDRIAEQEPAVRAWAHRDPELVLAAARALDAVPPAVRGPLHGLPIGVKDIMDTFDLPTEHGTAQYAGNRPAGDAAAVALARRAGAVVLGKTVTTELASYPPGPTANPQNLEHTPGGSSSGSAAAVAAGMVPVAFGTQTTGSIVRPAAFCGVVGVKPSFGLLPRCGVKALTEEFDTVGVIAGTVADAAYVLSGLTGRAALQPPADPAAPCIGVCLTPFFSAALPETVELFERLPQLLGEAGAPVTSVDLPESFAGGNELQNLIWEGEMASCLADEYRRFGDGLHPRIRAQIETGLLTTPEELDVARAAARALREAFPGVLGECDVLVAPSAPGEAPAGLEATGDPVFNRLWSLLHTPAVNVPARTGPSGLPLGVQVVGRPGDDAAVLSAAAWIEAALLSA
jgi:amidase